MRVPELPEVETLRVSLSRHLSGQTICAVNVDDPRLLKAHGIEALQDLLVGVEIVSVRRRGKYLLFDLDSGLVFISHLRLTGSWMLVDASLPRFTRATIDLSNGLRIAYVDVRRFGTWDLLPEGKETLFLEKRLGPDPLGNEFTPQTLSSGFHRRTTTVKAMILDQRIAAGVGNIYADEALHRARIHPSKEAGRLSVNQTARLAIAIRETLKLAIQQQRGTTATAGYYGGGLRKFRVFEREGLPCLVCRRRIVKTRVAGRRTYHCPRCQRVPTKPNS